jgi:hypothetical protein
MLTVKKHYPHPRIAAAAAMKHFSVLALLMLFSTLVLHAQRKPVRGTVINAFTKEQVPFASIQWKKAGYGTLTDSLGRFSLTGSGNTYDTLIISYVGFSNLLIPVKNTDTATLVLFLSESRQKDSVIVSSKYNKGLLWWRRVVKNKPQNNPYQFDSYTYELYNKLELDINNINRDGFNQYKLLRPFGFILNNIDSVSENSPFLPVFMAESLSDYFYTATPYQVREEIKAVQTNGIKNETVLQFIGGVNQRLNSYDNYMTLFGKEFISPLSSVAESYYNFRGADTQMISGDRYFHLFFSPKRDGENTFTGDCWIHNATWAIKKINLSIAATANINYVNRLSIVQEFTQQSNGKWVSMKDKFVADISPARKNKLSLIARKTAMYRNVQVNQPSIIETLKKNTEKEQVVVLDSAKVQNNAYWQQNRHEELSVNEQKVYKMIDTLKSLPLFKKYMNTLEFIVDGRKKYGAIEIGPWYRWVSGNQLEKVRVRFDVATTEKFSRYLRFHTYLAYGFGDKAFKGKVDGSYKLPGKSGYSFHASYTHDLDNGRTKYNDEDATTDNMFSQLIRRQGIKQKFLLIDEVKVGVTKEWQSHLSMQLGLSRTEYETFNPLPPKSDLAVNTNDITATELSLKIRYAPGERKIITHRKDLRIRGLLPITELRYAHGINDLFSGGYGYDKVSASVTQNFRLPRWGKISYMLYGGKIYSGAMPFMLLETHPGNEIYYYNKNAFNLMNRFEFVSDEYAGINIEHNFEKKLLNLLPFMRKTNMRQFWNVKAVWGHLTDENKKLNRIEYGTYRLRGLKGNSYIEVGTGLDNIFKFFRIDFVWRFVEPMKVIPGLPPPQYKNSTSNFGVFGSLHLQF